MGRQTSDNNNNNNQRLKTVLKHAPNASLTSHPSKHIKRSATSTSDRAAVSLLAAIATRE